MRQFKKGLVTIIVPVYNVEKYIERCLKSIYDQNYTNFEVLIVNDGSTDCSKKIIIESCLYDSRFIYIEKENGGLSSARNAGLDQANGEYIIFIDSDDWILPRYIEEMISHFEDDIDVLIGKYYLEDTIINKRYIPYESEKIEKIYYGERKEREILERHLNAYYGVGYEIKDTTLPVWKNAYRHSTIEDNGLRFVSEREVMAEDYIFNMEAYYYANSVKVAPVAGYVHEIIANSLSRKYRSNAIDMTLKRRLCAEKFIEQHSVLDRETLKKAIVTDFTRSIALDLRNIVSSNVNGKLGMIKNVLENSIINEVFKRKTKYNVSKIFQICIFIVKTKIPLFIYISFKIINWCVGLYRIQQYTVRK